MDDAPRMETGLTTLVTGATSGIGRHASLELARRGHRVIATGRRPSALAELAAEAEAQAPGRLLTTLLDVDDPASITAAAASVDELTDHRGVDVIINNAGFASVSPIADITDADLRAVFETNVFGLVNVTRAFLPPMMERGAGRIINVSSSGGRISLPFVGAYHGAKFAVEALSDALRWELRPFGISVSVIEPGPIRTGFADRMLASTESLDPSSRYAPIYADIGRFQAFAERQMLGPEAVTRAIVHAAQARRPRPRYLVPRRLGVIIALLKMLPTCTLDALMCRFAGLTRRKLGSARAARPVT
jgi:NAD(P)-dependent dehydrogenase (short-subunit alcohol dehydrogenase family)